MRRLIITNGQSGIEAIQQAGIEGDLMSWDDVLHEGPVPQGLTLAAMSRVRAAYLASRGWGDAGSIEARFTARDNRLREAPERFEEIVLYFEHDLYDQLQLFQLLDWFNDRKTTPDGMVSQAIPPTHIGYASPEELVRSFNSRQPLSIDEVASGAMCWAAFAAPLPHALAELSARTFPALPHAGTAFQRLLQVYPDIKTGLSRTESAIVELIGEGIEKPVALFKAYQKTEEAAFMGDASFWGLLDCLAKEEAPLISIRSRTAEIPSLKENSEAFLGASFTLTSLGIDVLAGRRNRVALNGIDRWIGGVYLTAEDVWYWDPAGFRFARRLSR